MPLQKYVTPRSCPTNSIPLFLWPVIWFFTSASKSGQLAICIWRTVCSSLPVILPLDSSSDIFSDESGPECLSASLLSCYFVNFITFDLNPSVYKIVCSLHIPLITLSPCATGKNVLLYNYCQQQWNFACPALRLTHHNHCYASSKRRNLSCYKCRTDSVTDCKMQVNFILYFPGQTKLHRMYKKYGNLSDNTGVQCN